MNIILDIYIYFLILQNESNIYRQNTTIFKRVSFYFIFNYTR